MFFIRNIVFELQTFEPAKWTTNAIVFELEVIGVNYFGSGRSLGISAPIVTETTITNRLLNYITFESAGPVDFVDYLPVTQVRLTDVFSNMEYHSN